MLSATTVKSLRSSMEKSGREQSSSEPFCLEGRVCLLHPIGPGAFE